VFKYIPNDIFPNVFQMTLSANHLKCVPRLASTSYFLLLLWGLSGSLERANEVLQHVAYSLKMQCHRRCCWEVRDTHTIWCVFPTSGEEQKCLARCPNIFICLNLKRQSANIYIACYFTLLVTFHWIITNAFFRLLIRHTVVIFENSLVVQ
jgi:hypothetical protein